MSDISREDEIIGANVKKFRESQGISRKDLATYLSHFRRWSISY